MFRVKTGERFEGPHQETKVFTHGTDIDEAGAAMILVHGRGAPAQSMFPLADEFEASEMHYIAPQASGYTWYPFSFLAPLEKNQPGISSGLQLIHDLVTSLEEKGFDKSRIMLLGFSQGACLTTEFVARHPNRYGGVIAFSGGLIGPDIDPELYKGSLEQTPVFLGCSDVDPHIPRERVDVTAKVLEHLGGQVDKQIYEGMAHTVNRSEIEAARRLIQRVPGQN